jgi:hypothetical protein
VFELDFVCHVNDLGLRRKVASPRRFELLYPP